jgi:alkaline phosphatase D
MIGQKILLKFILLTGLISLMSERKATCSEIYLTQKPHVVILSLDGFRWDYLDLYHTPNLDSIGRVGVKAHSLKPCFPSKTFPNHYSIATGMHPDHHGIVSNSFLDPKLNLKYSLGNRKAVRDARFYQGEPMWVTAEKQDVKSACYFWPGSEAPIKGVYPSKWKKYVHKMPFESRIDSVINWLSLPQQKRPRLLMWYMHEPDLAGHLYGPRSKETRRMVERLDSLVGVFCKKMNKLPIAESVQLIVLSDHGMGAISPQKVVDLSKVLKEEWLEDISGSNPFYMIKPKAEFVEKVYKHLKAEKHIRTFKKDEVPKRLVFGSNDRIYPIVCVADSAWSIYWNKKKYSKGGTHGYDPDNKDMHAIFLAAGNQFKRNYSHPTFSNTEVYNLVMHLLGVKPAENDGNIERVKSILKDTE